MKGPPRFSIHLLILARAAMAGLLPLSADEAYYWLWSKHPDFGYFDHPPVIAWLIRAGTMLFGDTAFGVRAMGILLSALATLFVWEAARSLLKDEAKAVWAALLFNLTLMIGVEMLAATPDMPSIATSAALLFCLCRVQDAGTHGPASENRRRSYWLWAGLAAGLGLLSKYSAMFLVAGTFLWLVASPRGRIWLKTPWPWAGALLALAVFLPNLVWQAQHGWETFAFQFGRVGAGHLTARFLFEFLGAQLGLASPFILVLAVAGLAAARPRDDLFLPAALVLPAIVYFLIHSLHDRVQGNWPCFLYPMLAILAVAAFGERGWRKWCAGLAAPVAGLLLVLVYAQALFGILPLGRSDPLARLLGTGFRPVADSLAATARAAHAGAVLTTDYETTAWLRFYEPGLTVVQLGQTYRYPHGTVPAGLTGPFLYFVEEKRDESARVARHFAHLALATRLRVGRRGQTLATYDIYLAEHPKGTLPGRMP